MENLLDKTVGSIVTEDYRAASVFERNDIDFCCKGKTKLSEACKLKNVDPELITKELLELGERTEESVDFNALPLDGLVNYIMDKHHNYVKGVLPQLQSFLEKICSVHGSHHPELIEIKKLFDDGVDKLTVHMQKEEFILFPYVKKLAEARKLGTNPAMPHFGTVQNPIHSMEHEHATEGSRFDEIRSISSNYTIPEDACTTYKVTYAMLKEFEEDLHRHIHLENNILFPKTIELEKELLNDTH